MEEMTSPTRNDRYDIEDEFNALQFELCEAAEIAFRCKGRNRFSFSRLFLVFRTAPGEPSVLINHTGSQRFEMEEGAIYFLPSGIDFEYDFRPATRFLSFHFHLRHYGREVFAGESSCQVSRNRMPDISRILTLMRRESLTLRELWHLHSLLEAEVTGYLPSAEAEDRAAEQARYIRYAKLLRFLREEAHGALSIEELAAVAGIPQERLSREFPRDFGIPLKRYLAQAVTARAEALLRDPATKVREAARLLRFRDEYYFSRFFKKETGTSPSAYRKLVIRAPF